MERGSKKSSRDLQRPGISRAAQTPENRPKRRLRSEAAAVHSPVTLRSAWRAARPNSQVNSRRADIVERAKRL